MNNRTPAYYRARIDVFRQLQTRLSKSAEDNMNLVLVRSGVFPPDQDEQESIKEYLRQNQYPDTPLSFTELCTYNTWFQMHPDKVCGTEKITSSREFPVTIRGDRQTIEDTIGRFLPAQKPESVASLELEALALELELQLLEL
ncbi:MAG: hypothetical protein LW693_13190 [Saprospiraceae bacterium]|nr:hypothetical protein [Saprospiraceae bacterium]